jgi:class 3 adenylate cyclase
MLLSASTVNREGTRRPGSAFQMTPGIRFLTTPDGVRIAAAVHGSGPPLVFVRGWISHLELLWDDPSFRAYFEALGRAFTVVRFDMRGNGMSDRNVPPVDLDAMVMDVETVMDGLGIERAVIYGQAYGGPPAIAYAAARPERVSHLVLDGTFADGRRMTTPERQDRIVSTLRELPEAGLLLLAHYTHPNPPATRFRQVERSADVIEPSFAADLYELGFRIDVTHLLPRIVAPALVMHRRKTRAQPFRLGRELASCIAGARFVALEGVAHNSWEEEPEAALAALSDFLGVRVAIETPDAPARRDAALTILFTDIEDSTPTTLRLGDAGAQELVREHNAIVRDALRSHDGDEIKHTGDGIMASFASASHAVECAIDIQRALMRRNEEAASPLRVRIGLNAGEPVLEDRDLFGTAVQLAKRVCDAGEPDTILVTNVIRELCAGKGFMFRGRGAADLKGFDEPVRLFEVRWAE